MPSPVCFTSLPSCEMRLILTISLCFLRIVIALSSPTVCVRSVEPTISVNKKGSQKMAWFEVDILTIGGYDDKKLFHSKF